MSAPTYLSTKPCKKGHTGPRYKSSNGCVECARLRSEIRSEQRAQIKANAPPNDWKIIMRVAHILQNGTRAQRDKIKSALY